MPRAISSAWPKSDVVGWRGVARSVAVLVMTSSSDVQSGVCPGGLTFNPATIGGRGYVAPQRRMAGGHCARSPRTEHPADKT